MSMDILQDVLDQIKTLGPEALTITLVIALAYLVRVAPFIRNNYIPWFCILLGAVCYVVIGDPGSVPFTTRQPNVVLAMFGMVYGVFGWALHHLVIARIEEWARKKLGQKEEVSPDNP